MKKMKNLIAACILLLAFSGNYLQGQTLEESLAAQIDITVSIDGTGDYTTVNEAVEAVSDNSVDETVIFVRNGIYNEKVNLPYTKTNVTLIGENVDSTVITYNDDPNTTGGDTWGTYTFRADADNFTAINITFENSAGDKGQALAFSSFGDKQLFYHCRFLGWQDTYYVNWRARNYMKDCFVEGAVDYIYGYGIALFDSCQIHTVRSGGVITASASSQYNSYGLTFRNSRLTTSNVSGVALGRPWQSKPHVAYLFCDESAGISAAGWTGMNAGRKPVFAEYNCTGEGYKPDSRSTNTDYPGIQLTDVEAEAYASINDIFAAASFADASEEQAEVTEMRTPFDEADLTDLIMGVMKSGRDTFPDIPTDDWIVDIENNGFVQEVKTRFSPFMDSANFVQPEINQVAVGGIALSDFSSDVFLYGIELPEGTSEVPEMTVDIENGTYEIIYPGTLPGFTDLKVKSYDKVMNYTYKIYNSIDGAYTNADLAFLGYNRTDTIDLVDEQYEYDVTLAEGVTRVISIQRETLVDYADTDYEKPSEIPGEGTVTVTAVDGVTQQVYTINFSAAVGVDETNMQRDFIRISNPVHRFAKVSILEPISDHIVFSVFDVNGKILKTEMIHTGAGSEFEINFSDLTTGMYFVEANAGDKTFMGKVLKVSN